MTETQLTLGNQLQEDRKQVYNQAQKLKKSIEEVGRMTFLTESPKEDYDDFKVKLLSLCDQWVEDQRKKIDAKFVSL